MRVKTWHAILVQLAWLPLLLTTPGARAQNGNGLDTQELQRRLITAALRQIAAAPADAPPPAQDPKAVATQEESQEALPSFYGTPIPRSTDTSLSGSGQYNKSTAFPVMSTDQLTGLSDNELYEVFHKGTAEIPSALPGQVGKFTSCEGKALLNNFNRNGWPNGTLQTGDYSFLNDFINRGWRGKILLTDPVDNTTHLWNLFVNNSTVDVVANTTILKGGISPDHKDSVIFNYNRTNSIFLRTLKDELRRVGPHIWLGRAWVVNPIEAWQPFAVDPVVKPIVDTAFQVENATWIGTLAATGIEGPLSSATTSGGHYPTLGQPLALMYFVIDCADYPVPRLHYTPVLAPVSAFLNSLTGYEVPFYSLPDLEKYNNTGDVGAVDNLNFSWPITSQRHSEPYVLWPYSFQDPNGLLDGYLQFPAEWFAPLFGWYWAISNQTAPAISAAGQLGNSLHLQNIDEWFPGLPALVARNPLSPFQNGTEALANATRQAWAPVADPINAYILDVNRTLVAPQSETFRRQSEMIAAAFAPAVHDTLGLLPNIDGLVGSHAPLPSIFRGAADTAISTIAAAPGTADVLAVATNVANAASSASEAHVALAPANAYTPYLTDGVHAAGKAIYGPNHTAGSG